MDGERKPWGTVWNVHRDSRLELNLLSIKPGGYSSEHFHQGTGNVFVVVAGKLFVKVFTPGIEGETCAQYELGGEERAMVCRPNEFHQFQAGPQGATVYEVVYAAKDVMVPDDIIRRTMNGVLSTLSKQSPNE